VLLQRYIRNPLLIRGYKFDLRFYVCVASLDPLRVYIYSNGLVRLAAERYCESYDDFTNLFAHLTNFSINKENSEFRITADGTGNKWSFEAFWPFLESLGYDSLKVRHDVEDAVVIVIMAGRPELIAQKNHRCSFEMYGFAVPIDADGQIHVLEVNLAPALGVTSALDRRIKKPLVRDFLNLALIPERNATSEKIEEVFADPGMTELAKFIAVVELEVADQRRGGFQKIFPVPERILSFEKFMAPSKLDRAIGRYTLMSEVEKEQYFESMVPLFVHYLEDVVDT
jgi:hypothetical protein